MTKREDEHLASLVLQAALGVSVTRHDDGSRPGMYDLAVAYPDGRRAAVEVVSTRDKATWDLEAAIDKLGYTRCPQLGRMWLISVDPGAKIKQLARAATGIGLDQRYTKEAVLLACLYVCYCLAGLLSEAAALLEQAPKKYVADPGTASLRRLIDRVPRDFHYFWFLFNEAPLYDKFQHAVNHLSGEELASYGHYSKVPSELVAFDQHIYGHLGDALRGWSNRRCGVYESPLFRSRN